jgi:hypothetical protein
MVDTKGALTFSTLPCIGPCLKCKFKELPMSKNAENILPPWNMHGEAD